MLKYNMESETFLLGMTKVKTSSNKKAKKQNKQQNLSTDKKQKQRIWVSSQCFKTDFLAHFGAERLKKKTQQTTEYQENLVNLKA